MLTPQKVREIEFQKAGFNGYKMTDVQMFLEEVASEIESLHRQNQDLVKKIQVLAENIEEYRNYEDSVKTAIIGAQKMADNIINEAKANAEAYTKEHQDKADLKLKQATEEAEEILALAKAQTQTLLDDATIRSKTMISKAEEDAKNANLLIRKKISQQLALYTKVKNQVTEFKDDLVAKYNNQISLLENMLEKEKPIEKFEEPLPEDTFENDFLQEAEESSSDFKVEETLEQSVSNDDFANSLSE